MQPSRHKQRDVEEALNLLLLLMALDPGKPYGPGKPYDPAPRLVAG